MYGVTALLPDRAAPLKQHALLFDQLHLVRPNIAYAKEYREVLRMQAAECDFLEKQGLISFISKDQFDSAMAHQSWEERVNRETSPREVARRQFEDFRSHHETLYKGEMDESRWGGFNRTLAGGIWNEAKNDLFSSRLLFGECVRLMAAELGAAPERNTDYDVVPLCWFADNPSLSEHLESTSSAEVLKIGMHMLPSPEDNCAWEDILAFKNDARDQLWALRRFLHSLSTKKQTEAEIRDDLEWSLNEYTKAMKIHNLKSGNSFMEVYVIPALPQVWCRRKGSFGIKVVYGNEVDQSKPLAGEIRAYSARRGSWRQRMGGASRRRRFVDLPGLRSEVFSST